MTMHARTRFATPLALSAAFGVALVFGACMGASADESDSGTEGQGQSGGQDSSSMTDGSSSRGSEGGSSSGPGGTGGGGGGGSVGEGLPCDVREVLAASCWGCHGASPRYGAPMSLVSAADFAAPAKSDAGASVFELVAPRLEDSARPMPPTGDLAEADKQVLLDFVASGAQASDAVCGDDTPPSATAPNPDEGDAPEELACEVTHRFLAHKSGTTEPYQVPRVGAENLYQCFAFKSPFSAGQQATAWAPVTDDERVLHHWILYRTKTAQVEGSSSVCNMPEDAQFVAGWAPGGRNFTLPDDVGLELAGPDDWFILQVHYHNAAHYDDALDASGVAFCTTPTPRAKTAGILTLGKVFFSVPAGSASYDVEGNCPSWASRVLKEPLHAIASFPHMHQIGRAFRTEIQKGGDAKNVTSLVEVPSFNFENQIFYRHEPAVTIEPGDALRTVCTYENAGSQAVNFGERTEDEMCFNFVMVYPIDALGENRSCTF